MLPVDFIRMHLNCLLTFCNRIHVKLLIVIWSTQELEATRTLGQKNLADAVKTANINKDRADALILKAEAALLNFSI